MKILYVVESLSVGGAEKVAVMLANLFSRNNHDVSLLVLNEPYTLQNELDENIECYHLDRKRKFDFSKMFQFNKYARKFDLIHCHMKGAYRYVAFISKIFFLPTSLIFHDHNGDIDLKPKADFSLKYIVKPQFYVAVCTPLVKWGVEKLKINSSRAFVLENTVPKFNYGNSVTTNGRIILVSNFRSTKNIEFAIKIAARLNNTLDIYGRINDEKYYQSILNLIEEYGVSDKINIINSNAEIRKNLNEYTLAIHTAKSESGPLVLLEYLNAGVPFVTFRTGEVVGQIADRFPNMIMDDFNVEAWVERINELIRNSNETFRNSLKDIYLIRFSEESYYLKCLDIYNRILIA